MISYKFVILSISIVLNMFWFWEQIRLSIKWRLNWNSINFLKILSAVIFLDNSIIINYIIPVVKSPTRSTNVAPRAHTAIPARYQQGTTVSAIERLRRKVDAHFGSCLRRVFPIGEHLVGPVQRAGGPRTPPTTRHNRERLWWSVYRLHGARCSDNVDVAYKHRFSRTAERE